MNIYFLCPEGNKPCGGVKQLYRQVDILNRNGFPASILYQQEGHRCTWFENNTRISYEARIRLEPSDILVVPEIYGPTITNFARGNKKVIFNQNIYNTFNGYNLDKNNLTTPYTDGKVVATIVVSEDNKEYLEYVFPQHKVYRIHNGIDSTLFHYQADKKPLLSFMPRKNPQDILQVINILKFRDSINGFELAPIANKSEREVAAILKESLIFLSFGYPEGFSLPPAEAMACGCITIGYHGYGGREFLKPEYAYPVNQGDIVTFARTVEEIIRAYRVNPVLFTNMAQRAANYIRDNYSLAREEKDIITVWQDILRA